VRYWQNDFDWRSREAELNCFNHFQTEIDDCKIHFIHEKGAGANPIPLLLTHGYPDSFSRFQKIIPLLTEEKDGVSFDVVVPSIPGYGFSDKPKEKGMLLRTFRKIFCRRRANSSSDFSTSSVGRRCHAVDILPPLKNRNC
jgi:pimeloyl-ACP methyl ester carboxylesterase